MKSRDGKDVLVKCNAAKSDIKNITWQKIQVFKLEIIPLK
jgi:hypothetical protein